MLHSSWNGITLQEVPDEISLAISISGCPLACKGCHSKETWDQTYGTPLTVELLNNLIVKNKHISCLIFYGGEWNPTYLESLLKAAYSHNIDLCLFTGLELDQVPENLLPYLTYIKTGRYVEKLGGLQSPDTNQKLIRLKDT